MLRILHDTKIDFIRRWRTAIIGVIIFIVPALILIIAKGFNYSIEFTGGTRMQIEFDQPVNAALVSSAREGLTGVGITSFEISTFGDREVVVRAQDVARSADTARGADHVSQLIRRAFDSKFGKDAYRVVGTQAVGPKVGGELQRQAIVALVIAFALTLVYLAWRFEWRFSLAAVLATLHDIIATLAFMKYLDLEISLFVIGGILTVIGYSMNDKVVVFDRVRENLKKGRKEALYDLLNRSVNETLPRTVMTGSTTLACLLALLIFGGEVIRPFAWVLTFGILIGTFSSIYVASPILLWIERKYPRAGSEKGHVTARQARETSHAEGAPTSRKAGTRGAGAASVR